MAADSSNRGSAPQEKAGDTAYQPSPEILAEWLKEYKQHFWVINMENDRMRRISKVLREITKADDVFIFLMHPRRPSTLVQRGAFDADLTIFDGHDESESSSKDIESLAKGLVGKTNPMQDAKESAWLRAAALGASCPLEGAYTEMALKMQGPDEEGITIDKERKRWHVSVTKEKYDSDTHVPKWPKILEKNRGTYLWLEKTVYVRDAEDSGAKDGKEAKAGTDQEFMVLKPLYMFGQSAAVWVYFATRKPSELPDFSPVFEGLMLERFPRHCERVDLLDGKEALPDFLRGCAYLWRPRTLCAKDKHGNCLAALGYPKEHIFNTHLGTIDPPSPENNSGNDSTFRIEYLRHAPSPSEAFASVKKEGKRYIVRFHALDLPDNHVRVFPDLDSIAWEVPDTVIKDVIESVKGKQQIKEAFKRQLERVSRSLSEGFDVLGKRWSELKTVETSERAERADAIAGAVETIEHNLSNVVFAKRQGSNSPWMRIKALRQLVQPCAHADHSNVLLNDIEHRFDITYLRLKALASLTRKNGTHSGGFERFTKSYTIQSFVKDWFFDSLRSYRDCRSPDRDDPQKMLLSLHCQDTSATWKFVLPRSYFEPIESTLVESNLDSFCTEQGPYKVRASDRLCMIVSELTYNAVKSLAALPENFERKLDVSVALVRDKLPTTSPPQSMTVSLEYCNQCTAQDAERISMPSQERRGLWLNRMLAGEETDYRIEVRRENEECFAVVRHHIGIYEEP